MATQNRQSRVATAACSCAPRLALLKLDLVWSVARFCSRSSRDAAALACTPRRPPSAETLCANAANRQIIQNFSNYAIKQVVPMPMVFAQTFTQLASG